MPRASGDEKMWQLSRRMAPDDAAAGGGGSGQAAAAGGAPAPAPAPVPAAGDAAAAADAGKGGNGASDAQGFWPADWRERVAGEDPRGRERLGRYASPADVAKALIAAQNKISSGELKPALGKNASAEEVAQWRKAHGIPEVPDKYDLDLGG